jgi:hypothetical protein
MYHLSAKEKLFRRAVLQSRSPFGTQDMREKDAEYQRLLTALERERARAPKERLEAPRKVEVETLTKVESVQTIFPYFGPGTEEMFEAGRAPDYANAAQLVSEGLWVEDVVVSDCQFKGYAFAPFLKHVDSRKLVRHFKTILGFSVAEKLLNVYGIDLEGHIDGNLFWANVMLLDGDAFLSEPMETLADTLAGST